MSAERKTLLFSVTKDDFVWQSFRSGGKGGQNQNKVNSGCRCIHPPSGARGEARDSRDWHQNRQSAFTRCVSSPLFQAWHKAEIAKRLGHKTLEESVNERVDQMMAPENLRIE